MLRRFKSLHTWAGITTGLLLFVAFYAGAASMFKAQLDDWATPSSHSPAVIDDAARDQVVRGLLAKHPDVTNVVVRMMPAARAPATVMAQSGRGKSLQQQAATLDSQGHVLLEPAYPTPLADWVDRIHRTGGLPVSMERGVLIMGIASGLYALALVSGILVMLPTFLNDLLALRFRRENPKRGWLDLHNLLGVASLPFHIIMAASAMVFAFHDVIYDAQDYSIHRGSPVAGAAFAPFPPSPVLPAQVWLPDQINARLHQLAPDFQVSEIQYRAQSPNARGERKITAFVKGHTPNHFLRGVDFGAVMLDAGDGRVLYSGFLPGQQGTWSQAVASFFALHFGNYGGNPIRWTYVLLGVIGAAVFYTGNLLWIESRRKRQRKNRAAVLQPRKASIMAAATVGVCLGSVIGISSTIALAHIQPGNAPDALIHHQLAYFLPLLLAVVWALWRKPALAAIDLLSIAAIVTALIPALTMLDYLWPRISVLEAGRDGLAVELTALVAASLMLLLARLSRHRAKSAPHDSVWAAAHAPKMVHETEAKSIA